MDGIQVLFWFVLVPIGIIFATYSAFKENREKHRSKLKATTQTAKDGGQAIFMGVVIVVGFLIFLWIVNGAQTGVGQP
jgi:hypothetical protein